MPFSIFLRMEQTISAMFEFTFPKLFAKLELT